MALKIGSNYGYPHVLTTIDNFRTLVTDMDAIKYPFLGLDLEWDVNTNRPTVMGIAHPGLPHANTNPMHQCAHSVEWNNDTEQMLRMLLSETDELVGHNIIGGDIPVLMRNLLFPTIPQKHFDTLIYFYLTNAHLCKARSEKPSSTREEYEKEAATKGGGFMNIWTMASLYTDLPNWKECRKDQCHGPCPTHDVFGYNGVDALAPLLAKDALERDARLKRVTHLVPIFARATTISAEMTARGIRVDQKYLAEFEQEIINAQNDVLTELDALAGVNSGDVNWDSWQQIKKFFKTKYSLEPTTTSEEDLEDFFNEHGFPEAEKLVEKKQVGRGLTAWFNEKYIDGEGYLHPKFKPVGGTCDARWASSGPNFQNIPTRRSKAVRKIIIARDGYRLYKADYKQAEARAILYQAGYQDMPQDGSFKQWLLDNVAFDPEDAGVKALGGVWNATKSMIHACHNGEGITLVEPAKLKTNYYLNLISKGALEVNEGWMFYGKVVCRTGANLATRMFGRATFANRKKALDLQRRYFTKFPKVVEWQKAISQQIERDQFVRSPFGFYLQLYGPPFPMLKTGLSSLGQNPVAMFTDLAIARAFDDGIIPSWQVHDELGFELPEDWPRHKCVDRIVDYMEFETEYMPGFKLPCEVSECKSWGEGVTVWG